jgi:hypothetical protein
MAVATVGELIEAMAPGDFVRLLGTPESSWGQISNERRKQSSAMATPSSLPKVVGSCAGISPSSRTTAGALSYSEDNDPGAQAL